jgi:acyl-CoA reductase-like NAD-dependent aldehyde dehydrogenase
VQKPVFDKVIAGIAEIAQNMRIGDGSDDSTELGPLISSAQRSRVLGYVADGVNTGAELVTGGKAVDRPGYFVEPSVFVNTRPEQKIVREEIFGPVLAAMPFDDLSQVAKLANATSYGLGAGVFTTSLSTAHKAARAIRAGNIWVNFYGGSDKSLPFGGYKESGWGREGAYAGLDAFLEQKAVYMRL